MHGSRGSGHCEGAGDASERAYEQAVRNHLHLTSRRYAAVTRTNDRKELWFRAAPTLSI